MLKDQNPKRRAGYRQGAMDVPSERIGVSVCRSIGEKPETLEHGTLNHLRITFAKATADKKATVDKTAGRPERSGLPEER